MFHGTKCVFIEVQDSGLAGQALSPRLSTAGNTQNPPSRFTLSSPIQVASKNDRPKSVNERFALSVACPKTNLPSSILIPMAIPLLISSVQLRLYAMISYIF
jgi:hypothetical protein